MSLPDHVIVDITSDTATVTRAGFGVPLAMVHHTLPGALVRTYTGVDGVLSDFNNDENHPAVRHARAIRAQSPTVPRFKIGKVPTAVIQAFTIGGLPTNAADAEVNVEVSLTVLSPGGVSTQISYVIQAADTDVIIATALAAQIDAIADLSAAVNANEVDVTADNAGEHFYAIGFRNCSYDDTTPDAGYVAALTAIKLEDADFYGVLIEHENSVNIQAVAAAVQTEPLIFGAQFKGTVAAYVALCTTLDAANYGRTFTAYHGARDQTTAQEGVTGWMAGRFPQDPGSQTWKFKGVNLLTADPLTPSEQTQIKAVNGNVYVRDGGVDFFQEGVMANGTFIDTVRFDDWLVARVKEAVLQLFVSTDVDYDDFGFEQILAEVEGVALLGVTNRGLAAVPPPVVSAPSANDVSEADRRARCVPDIKLEAQRRGKVHKARVSINVFV